MLLHKYWTANQGATPGSIEDVFKFNPWRAPCQSPVFDACGMAGGVSTGSFNAAEYKVLKPRPTGIVWKRGEDAAARWQITAN
jgi:hypothetical protein